MSVVFVCGRAGGLSVSSTVALLFVWCRLRWFVIVVPFVLVVGFVCLLEFFASCLAVCVCVKLVEVAVSSNQPDGVPSVGKEWRGLYFFRCLTASIESWERMLVDECAIYNRKFLALQLNLLGAEVTVISKAVPPGRDLAIALRRG